MEYTLKGDALILRLYHPVGLSREKMKGLQLKKRMRGGNPLGKKEKSGADRASLAHLHSQGKTICNK